MAAKKKTKPDSDLRLIPCRVEPGMFRDEYLAVLEGLNPNNPEETIRATLRGRSRCERRPGQS